VRLASAAVAAPGIASVARRAVAPAAMGTACQAQVIRVVPGGLELWSGSHPHDMLGGSKFQAHFV